MYLDWTFYAKRWCSNNKKEKHDYRSAGGVSSLNQYRKLRWRTNKGEEELRRTHRNPNGIWEEEEELTGAVGQWRRADEIWSIQVDAATVVDAVAKIEGGGGARVLRRREMEERYEEKRGKVKGTPGPIYNVKRLSGRRGNRGGQKMDMRQHRRLDFRRFIKRRDVLKFGLWVILMTGDVMAGYHNPRRWRHGGLQGLARINEEGFF